MIYIIYYFYYFSSSLYPKLYESNFHIQKYIITISLVVFNFFTHASRFVLKNNLHKLVYLHLKQINIIRRIKVSV